MADPVERKEPRISVNKLGEYLVAAPAKRKSIIQDQKRPKTFQTAYYAEAQTAIVRYLTSPQPDLATLTRAAKLLEQAQASSDWEDQKNRSCADAIEAFSDIAEDLLEDLSVKVVAGPTAPEPLTIAGVAVNVRPDAYLRSERGKQDSVGALKLSFAKNGPLSSASASYIGWLVREHTESFPPSKHPVDRRICIVLDVFEGLSHPAPATFVRRRRDVEAACEEIGRAWASA